MVNTIYNTILNIVNWMIMDIVFSQIIYNSNTPWNQHNIINLWRIVSQIGWIFHNTFLRHMNRMYRIYRIFSKNDWLSKSWVLARVLCWSLLQVKSWTMYGDFSQVPQLGFGMCPFVMKWFERRFLRWVPNFFAFQLRLLDVWWTIFLCKLEALCGMEHVLHETSLKF